MQLFFCFKLLFNNKGAPTKKYLIVETLLFIELKNR